MRTARALLAVAVSGLCLVLMPTPAAATEPVASVTITLTSMEPELPTRDGEVTVTGRVTNITKERLYRLEALFWRNQAPILGRAGLEQALASESNDPLGARYTAAFQDLFTAENPFLAPNASVDFQLRVRVSDLELSPTDGVYLMGVHILQRGNNVAIGRARVFVPVVAAKPRNSLTMTSVVVLNTRPSLVRKGVLSDDHVAAEVGQNGRLTALLNAAAAPATSFAVDPALIEELQTMAAGYQVLDSEGSTSAGTGQADATRWLEGFERLRSSHDGYRLLYGTPDVAALVHDGQESVLKDAATANKLVESTRSLPLLVLPAGGTADADTAEAAAALQPDAILLADTSAKGPSPLLAGPNGVPIIRFAKGTQGGGPGPDPRDTAIHLRQRMLCRNVDRGNGSGRWPEPRKGSAHHDRSAGPGPCSRARGAVVEAAHSERTAQIHTGVMVAEVHLQLGRAGRPAHRGAAQQSQEVRLEQRHLRRPAGRCDARTGRGQCCGRAGCQRQVAQA